MPAKLLSVPDRVGKTFGIGIRVLGTIAVLQIIVAIWAVLIRFDGAERVTQSRPSMGFTNIQPLGSFDSALDTALVTNSLGLPSPTPGVTSVVPPLTEPAATNDSLFQPVPEIDIQPKSEPRAEHAAHRIDDLEGKTLLERALQMREQGDTQGALGALKEADSKVPGHPMVLSELATTYHRIGQKKKATQYWEQVHQLGPEKAGAYWDQSDMALKGHLLDEATSVDTQLRISRHFPLRVENAEGEAGQKVVLRIHTESTTESPVDGEQMYLYVYFYDLAKYPSGSRFEETVAKMSQKFVTPPYDWAEGEEEVIEVEYFLPELDKDQRAALGDRQFYGYVVELYYRDNLQDAVANPRKLFRKADAAPEGLPYQGSSLFPK